MNGPLRAWLVRIGAWLAGADHRARSEFEAEIRSHVELHTADGIRSGLSREQARRAALLKFGPVEAIREEYLDRGGVPLLRRTGFALRDARRALLRTPRFNLLVVLVLAVGVGANAGVFGLVDALIFRAPAHVRAPERLVTVSDVRNYVHYRELGERATALDITAYVRRPVVLGAGDDALQVDAECVTSTYFTVLAPSVTGPGFIPARAEPPGGAPSVVLAHSLWSTRFGRDPSVLGRSIPIAGMPHTVLAIAPPGFRGLGMMSVDAWILLPASPAACHPNGRSALDSASGSWLTVVGRMRDGVTVGEAEVEIQQLNIGAADLPPNTRSARALEPIHETRRGSIARDSRVALWLAAAAVIMLFVACANAAGLLGGRAVERRREIGVRLQLGASRSQVFFQLLAENLGLVFGCGIVALLVAAWMTSLLHAFFPISGSGALLDHRSIGLLAGIALVAAALSAIVPAAQTARGHLSTLWRSGHAVGQARSRLHHLLLIGQITFAMVLVTGAGLFVRSLHNLKANVGYDLERVIAASVDLERAGIRRHLEKRAVFDAVLQRLEQLPGVAAVGLSTSPPLGSGQSYVVLPRPPGAVQTSLPRTVNDVSPGYFESLGTRLLRGRAFSPEDGPSSAPVAIVDQGLASELWPGEDPVGTCKQIFSGSSCFRIVGISEPRRLVSLTRLSGEFFLPLAQRPSSVPQSILIRASESAGELVPQVAAAIRQAAANGPFVSVRPLVDMANVQARSWRLGATMFALFASIAIVLAVVGIYASLAAAVRQRTSEIGVRLTLGASPVVIALMVIRQGLSYVVAGWVLGTILSFALARSIEGLLFGVKPTDILTFTGASLLVAGAGAIGCAVPAWRAGHVDPVVALRTE